MYTLSITEQVAGNPDSSYLFANLESLISVGFTYFASSKMVSMYGMSYHDYQYAPDNRDGSINNLDTSNLEDVSYMFYSKNEWI